MKKNIILTISLILVAITTTFAQKSNPVSWKFESKKSGNNEYTLTFHADIKPEWYLYSQHIEEGGPIPTTFTFTPSENYELIGEVSESKENREIMKDDVFEMELIKFHNTAVFTQKVKVINKNKPISGTIQFMSCSKDRCNPPVTKDFSFKL